MTVVVPSLAFDRSLLAAQQSLTNKGETSLKRELDTLLMHDKTPLGFLMDVVLDGLWLWDLKNPEGRWVSDRFWEMLGYAPQDSETLETDWTELIHPEDIEERVARFTAYCASPDGLYDETLRYRHRDGGSIWLRCRGIVIHDANGTPLRLLGAHTNVTALKRTEEELLRGKAELTRLLAKSSETNAWLQMAEESGRIGRWHLTLPDHRLVWSNEMYRINGVSPETFAPSLDTLAGLMHPDDVERVLSVLESAVQDAQPFELETRLNPRQGAIRHVLCRGTVCHDMQGRASMLVGVLLDISEQKNLEQALREANARLQELANVDSLTRLANRRRFDEILILEWQRAAREHAALSLVMVDIDRFKGFNDRYGHPAGDECLRRVALVLAKHCRRPTDVVARYGGEEMVLLLPSTSAAGAETVARECRSSIAALGILHEGNMSCGGVITASFGVATAMPAEDAVISDWTTLLAEADRLLYEAKRTGRNKVMSPTSFDVSGAPPMPPDEDARLEALARYEASGATSRTPEMDGIARLAATLTGAPIAMVSYLTRDRKCLMGNFNLPGTNSMPRDVSLCTHTILGDEPMVVADAAQDVRFKDSPVVTGGLGVRYYAGAPIVSQSSGHKLGTLCVVDTVPHLKTGSAERAVLTDLAGMVAALMEDSLKLNDNEKARKEGLLF